MNLERPTSAPHKAPCVQNVIVLNFSNSVFFLHISAQNRT
jgi:hypothetical protein